MVITDTPGCRDVVADGVNGLPVPMGDGVALAVLGSEVTGLS